MKRKFSVEAVGKEFAEKPFELIKQYKNLKIPYNEFYLDYICERCDHKKGHVILHEIHLIEIYRFEEHIKIETQNPVDLWIGHSRDGKMLKIPKHRIDEVKKYITE